MFRVLSVDNNVTRANLTARAVRDLKFGVRIHYALSATQAVLYIAGCRQDNKVLPDMVILSGHLPDSTGVDALRAINNAMGRYHTPVIIIGDDKKKCHAPEFYKHGASAFVSRGSDLEAYMKGLGETVSFVAMVEGLIPKQADFFPEAQDLSIRDVLQVHL